MIAAIALGTIASTLLGTSAMGADAPTGPCPDGTGTVVVDFTDLGGRIEIGCATDWSTGTAALTSAGFADTRDASGMICAIDSLPDPCPAEFTGSWWSYWYGEDDSWRAWMEGSDTAAPGQGGIEGWRYSDGTAGPGITPAEAAELPATVTADGAVAPPADALPVWGPWVFGLLGLAAVGALAAVAIRQLRGTAHGPHGQD
jgi:hypothetical protein